MSLHFLYANSVVHENKTTPSILTHILSFTDLSGGGICALSIQEMGALFGQATIEMFPQMTQYTIILSIFCISFSLLQYF